MTRSARAVIFLVLCLLRATFGQAQDLLPQKLESFNDLRADYRGYVDERIDALIQNWVLRAPKANPAMLAVFQMRERTPKSSQYYVPWVGEFVGKYLESALLLLQTTKDKELSDTVVATIEALIACQDSDGYLGPYSRDERLRVQWDLWGHYHAITALTLAYERYNDANAFEAARRAGLFFEKVFYREGENQIGVKDVGSDEVNFAIATSLCQLYRLSREEHFLDAAKKVLAELEERGNFYNEGLAGVDFYRTPQPRWEALHTVLALEETARATGDETYRRAFLNLWESVYKRDVHNNGSFSSNERAVGSPYRDAAIETCCTVAWIALTVEALRASGESRCADALENSFYNAVCAYEHPSGSWCCYNAPMNGRREASFQSIVFQARPGQPELNCCSVNGPRGFAELVNWGVLQGKDDDGAPALFVNYYGESEQTFTFNNKKFKLSQKTQYPLDGKIELELSAQDDSQEEFTLYLRVPEGARDATVQTPENEELKPLEQGKYNPVKRVWKKGESISINFPLSLRLVAGDGDFNRCASVYYGPLLLAYDQYFNNCEPDDIPTISPQSLQNAEIEFVRPNPNAERIGFYSPQIFVKLDSAEENSRPLFLVDFAFAGALGATYVSWLPATETPPPVPACDSPAQDANVAPGAALFSWRKVTDSERFSFKVVVSDDVEFHNVLFEATSTNGRDALASAEQTRVLEPNKTYYWKIVASNEYGTTESLAPGRRFRVDKSLPEFDYEAYQAAQTARRTFSPLLVDALQGKPEPNAGRLANVANLESGDDSVKFNGRDSSVVYELEEFPKAEFEASLEFKLDELPERNRIAQIISAWSRANDDPLRVAINDQGQIYGSVEGARGGKTTPTKLATGKWYRLRVSKEDERRTLFLNDEEIGSLVVEPIMSTESLKIGLGCNPLFRNEPEFLNGEIRNFSLSGVSEKP